MNNEINGLFSSVQQRRFSATASSGSVLGIAVNDIVKGGLVGRPLTTTGQATPAPPSLGERVFNALSSAKIWTSRVAMHMDRNTRDRFFRQLDLLHDADEWFGDEQPLALNSYRSFIRFMLADGKNSKPSLALSPAGSLVAIWLSERDRLTIEFGAGDWAEWVVSLPLEERVERAAGSTSIARLSSVLAPYNPDRWLQVG